MGFPAVQSLRSATADRLSQYGPSPSQHREFWFPAQRDNSPPSEPPPLLVLIHGGCWLDQYGVDHARPLATALRDAGYPVLAPEYRRVGRDGGGWPESRDDLITAIALNKEAGNGRQFDADRLILIGHSAGGHLALTVAGALAESGDSQRLLGVIGLAAITDPVRYAEGSGSCNSATQRFFRGTPERAAEAYAAGDPLRAWAEEAASIPAVLIQGTADSIVPMRQAQALAAAPAVQLRVLRGAGHFDLIHPQTAAFGALLEAIDTLAEAADD